MKIRKKSKLKPIILFFIFIIIPVARPFTDSFTFRGDSLKTILARGKERTVLTGNVRIETEDTVIKADRVELFGENFVYANFSGDVEAVNSKRGIHLICENLFYNRKEKILRVQGYSEMEDKKNEVVVKGGFLEDWQDKEETIIQIGVRILKKDLVCRSEFARYNHKDNTLELSGMPMVFWKGDEYRATKIFIDLDNEEITLEGEIQGSLTTESKGESSNNSEQKK